MNSITAISPLLSSGNLLNETPFETSDELMLEELGRRDGIYSFIFHELESPKMSKINNEIDTTQIPIRNCRHSSLTSKSNFKRIELDAHMPAIVTSAPISTSTKTVSSLTSTMNNVHSTTSNGNTIKLPAKNEFLRYQQYLKTWYPPLPSSMPSSSLSSSTTTTITSTPSSLKLLPTKSSIAASSPFYLDKRQTNLYSYMMNCGVSVRPQPPRFSHITEPLVRNRRHALKECDSYKQRSNMKGSCSNNLNVPDLRSLFPYDPDVHAPFIKSGEAEVVGSCLKIESLEKSTASTILPPCSEIK